jgi:hypothetical protein
MAGLSPLGIFLRLHPWEQAPWRFSQSRLASLTFKVGLLYRLASLFRGQLAKRCEGHGRDARFMNSGEPNCCVCDKHDHLSRVRTQSGRE